jgi:chemotaxis protein CheX
MAPISLNVYRDDLARVVQSVFQTMMDLEVTPSDMPWTHSPDTITSAVLYVGPWRGAMLLGCQAPQACQFAARFMGVELPGGIDADVRDVMGELANMVAGNLKSLLPPGLELSTPIVVEGGDYALQMCGSVNAMERLTFSSAVGIFHVTLIEASPPA